MADRIVFPFSLPPFMASSSHRNSDTERPRPLQVSKSFSRIEPSIPGATRPQRANTFQNGTPTKSSKAQKGENVKPRSRSDVFGMHEEEEGDDRNDTPVTPKSQADFDELPIELISLTDSFIDSLSAKVHPTPPTVDKLSSLFQDFYILAATHINTHISALSSKQHRESSPAPSTSSRTSTANKFRNKAGSVGSKDRPKPLEKRDSEQQMLTTEEIAERKRARKVLEQKRTALEESVERRVCEAVYDRIWRHRSTQDEAQDEKLRSKTAALAVVGIGLADLGIDLGQGDPEKPTTEQEKEYAVREWLAGAREELLLMNEKRFPLGKLLHLKAAHKAIVDTLSHFHPSSSADEIMPMLIYTLITSPPEGINVISNLYFIQRFRSESKIDGEAAYCLTNLEAAVTFLETVDLASLREDESLAGPAKSHSRPTTPRSDRPPNFTFSSPGLSAPSLSPAVVSPLATEVSASEKPLPSPVTLRPALQVQNRRLSNLFQPPAQALGAAGDAVLTTADQGFKTIGDSLGSSYKFLVGKLKERQESIINNDSNASLIVPKTLDDARKLVGTPPPEDEGSISGASSLHSPAASVQVDDKVMNLIGGRKPARDRSVDSSGSGSGRKMGLAEEGKEKAASPLSAASLAAANPAIAETMRNLGSTLNPINRIAGMGMMRGFGRATPPATPSVPDGGVAELTTAFPHLAPDLPPKETPKIAPPIKRFMELQNPGEMRINEVLELLRDYRRLATALKDLGAV